jgi:hypothetical protein
MKLVVLRNGKYFLMPKKDVRKLQTRQKDMCWFYYPLMLDSHTERDMHIWRQAKFLSSGK